MLTKEQFLQSGNPDIGPANCWVGVDAPQQS